MIFNLIATSRYDAWYTKSKSQSQAMKVYSFLNYVAILRNFFQFRKRKLLIISFTNIKKKLKLVSRNSKKKEYSARRTTHTSVTDFPMT